MNLKCEFYYSDQSKYPECKLYQSRQLFLNLSDCQFHFGQVWEHFLWINHQQIKFIVSDQSIKSTQCPHDFNLQKLNSHARQVSNLHHFSEWIWDDTYFIGSSLLILAAMFSQSLSFLIRSPSDYLYL